ncbi:hypothetical protein [Rhodomicrobium lacus]|uniref:hypothetical protein n=1 Tax=Rhodomicrobium lacus TaxID=2498452 RepID=UPI000F8C805F|nr:hypothetical protein [Rhodomicrobium lacus]
MTATKIWYFIKFFSEERYAESFMRGQLYLNRLSYFRKLECSIDDDGRADTHEGVAMWWQPQDIRINLSVPGIGDIEITKDDLAAPVSTSYQYHEDLHIICLYSIYTNGYGAVDGKFHLDKEQAADFQSQILIDERCLKFGSYAVITPAVPFLAQVKEALQRRGQWFRGSLVEYYDDEMFHGEFASQDVAFKKQKQFAYQKEFRICLQTGTQGEDPIFLEG